MRTLDQKGLLLNSHTSLTVGEVSINEKLGAFAGVLTSSKVLYNQHPHILQDRNQNETSETLRSDRRLL